MQATHLIQPSGAVGHARDLSELRTHIRTLSTVGEDEAPIVSCYVHRAIVRDSARPPLLERRIRAIRTVLGGRQLDRFEEAFERVQHYLATVVLPTTRGIATFARAGAQPFFLGLQFQVPLPDRLSVSWTPDIFHHEQQGSFDAVAELVSALRHGGLGSAGTAATFEAERGGYADVLVMAREYEPGPAWACEHCGCAAAAASPHESCPECNSREVLSANLKGVMAKLAKRQSVEVEFVQQNDAVMGLGGVGCLLRYAAPEQDRWA